MLDGKAEYKKGEGSYTGLYPSGEVKMKGPVNGDKRIGEWELFDKRGNLVGTYKPIYEKDKPIFNTRRSAGQKAKLSSDKPEYLYENKQIRYFTPVVNEYKGFIISTNPLGPFFNSVPLALEFFKQERLGYEFQFNMVRNPFFKNFAQSNRDELFRSGFQIQLKQKFYHKDSKFGMFYFGHMIGYNEIIHRVKTLDAAFSQIQGRLDETDLYYGLIIGSRWLQRTADSGFTFDIYGGVATGFRNTQRSFTDPSLIEAFSEISQNRAYYSIVFGLNIGLIGPKRRLSK